MTTSRTGTASHKRWRLLVLREGQRQGITHCPLCSVLLDYSQGKQPNSAEPDHLIPWASGGRNTVDNGRVICRLCNIKRGNKPLRSQPAPRTVTTLIDW